jgi:serine/threonine-protein kinase HipA
VQLKAPVEVAHDDQGHVVLPVTGAGGSWIAKFPSALHVELPENEAAMLAWARDSGIDVPDHRLVTTASIRGLPPGFPTDGKALLLRRFDRGVNDARIHQEDFAQVFDLEPEVKYADDDALPEHVCYAAIAAVVARLCGPSAFDELLRRFCFMALSGNMDAHPKNWALLYPDGRTPTLAPAYDLVCTLAYAPAPVLALRWFPSTDPNHTPPGSVSELDVQLVRRIARVAGQPEERAVELARAFVSDARAAWRRLVPHVRVPELVLRSLEDHLDMVPIH